MLKPIKTEQQYEDALMRVYTLVQKGVTPESKESDELEILSILLKEYENEHYPVPAPGPLEAIRFRLDQMDMSERELSGILGSMIADSRSCYCDFPLASMGSTDSTLSFRIPYMRS